MKTNRSEYATVRAIKQGAAVPMRKPRGNRRNDGAAYLARWTFRALALAVAILAAVELAATVMGA